MLRTMSLVRVLVLLSLMTGMLGPVSVMPLSAQGPYSEDFETGFAGSNVGAHADWFDGDGGPVATAGIGVNSSVGLAGANNIFTWTAHPFDWNDASLTGVVIQMDFQSNSEGTGDPFNDDRVGWMIYADDIGSDHIFGVQFDDSDNKIEGYWDGVSATDKKPLITTWSPKRSTWYRLRVEITKLTATSAQIDVTVHELNPDGSIAVADVASGSIPNTSLLGDDAPNSKYFTAAAIWPGYKNYQSSSDGAADNAYFEVLTSGSPTCYALTLGHTGNGSDPVASPANSTGCPADQYVAGEVIGLSAVPDTGWYIASWTGTGDDSSTASTNSLTMPDSGHSADVNYTEIPPVLGVCEDFESGYTDGVELRTHADWFYESGHSGPDTVSTVGFNETWGLTDGGTIFTWVAHPFDWNGVTFQGIDLQMDFKTDGSGHFDDDRLGWMISDTDDDSSNIFGVQMDPGGSGASGYNIEGYWDGVTTADRTPSIVDLPVLTADTWYSFRAEITRLTATSASIDVELWSLDSGGSLDTLMASGSIADTSGLGADAPNSKYFTPTEMWPAYKNFTTAAAPADNACYEIVTSGAPTCYALTLGHTGQGSDPVASVANSAGCPAGEYVEGEVIGLSGAVPDPGWWIDGWTGTDNDSSTASTNSLTMPAGTHSADVNYAATPEPLAACEDFDAFTVDQRVGTHADWYDGGGGPYVRSSNGVAGLRGLEAAGGIFTWAAHPFSWNGPDFVGVNLQMDFQTDGSGHCDDDRVGWMISDSSTSSNYIFGIQLDPGGDGASGYNIEAYWDGDTFGDDGGRTSIVNLPVLTANTWYRFRAEITRLSATSASIDVTLTELDGSGNPGSVVASGSILDTDLLPNTEDEEIPNPGYFTGPIWPAYKNYTAAAASADNACFEIVTAADNTAPDQPTLVSPGDGAVGVSLPPELRVNVTDPDADALDVTFYGREVTAEDFTIIPLPDTQKYAASYPTIFISQTEWIVDSKDDLNIVYVAHEGDVVDTASSTTQWDNADAAMDLLEDPVTTSLPDGIPYSVVPGNHDQPTTNYNSYFGVSRFTGRGYYGGSYDSDNDDNYTLFSAEEMDFIAISLNYDITPDTLILDWADGLLKSYASRRGIIVSHYLIGTGNPGAFGTQGQAIYDALKDNPNLFLMLSGHIHGEGRREDTYNSSTVYTLLADYQDYSSGGNGYLRIMDFSPETDEIQVKTYSPYLDLFETDANSQFTLDYDMEAGGPFVELGTVNGVSSGSDAFITWPGLSTGTTYEWFVEASDAISTTASPEWTFTTELAPPTCYELTLGHSGQGTDPVASPTNSTGCSAGQYVAGESIDLSGAVPDSGWQIDSWTNTDDDSSTAGTNSLSMPASAHSASVNYTEIALTCYALTLGHTGQGSDPVASPSNSTGCPAGQYVAGESIDLSGAVPDPGWWIDGWTGTDNDSSTASTNSLTMPAGTHSADVNYAATPEPLAACEDFDAFTVDQRVGTHADWYDGGGGPYVRASNGVASSQGLEAAGSIFTWVAQPFSWNDPDFLGINLQMDFRTDGSGHCDDDRVGWMIRDDDDNSDYIFGIQLDPGGDGASGYNIEAYWDGDTFGDDGGRTSIVNLPVLTANTWYRLRAEITWLSATSASIDVSLTQLDGSGNPGAVVASGSIPDTDLLPNTTNEEIPNPGYFTGPIWPAYKNYTAAPAPADNACYEIVTAGAPTCYALTLGHTGQGSNPVASPTNSTGCSAGEYLAGESIDLSGALPDTGWQVGSWTGTDDDGSTASTNSLTMPASAQLVEVNYTEIAPTCYALTLGHTGQGSDPVASPTNSTGCSAGEYLAGESIDLSGALPDTGWQIGSWTGTGDDGSTASTNSLTMPASAQLVEVNYTDPASTCYALTLGHSGQGSDPVASPTNSTGCPAGEYLEGEAIDLSGALPDTGWEIHSWTGTDDDASTADTNSLTMPAINDYLAAVNYTELEPQACTEFESGYILDQELRIHADWFYEEAHSGPRPTAGAGVAGSIGLSNGDSIFTWVARPFYWNAPEFLGASLQMDFQTDASGHLEDDRIGWMISNTDDDSSNFFGVRLGPGGTGYNIAGIWDGVSLDERTPPIKDLPALSANTWYRVWVFITKLTATSAKIQVVVAELDAGGIPWKYITSGTMEDTSTLGADAPHAKYFTDPIWPAFKNSTSLSGAADLACLYVTRTGSVTIVKESDPAGGTGFSFDGGSLGAFSLDDGGSSTFENLAPGNYGVTEIDPIGWDLENVVCTGGDTDPIYQDPIINCWEDSHQDPVLPTVSDPLMLVPDDDAWTEYQESGSPLAGIFASPTEDPPLIKFYGIVPNGLYQVSAGLFRDSDYRYYYGYDPADPRALYVDVESGPQGYFSEFDLGTYEVTNTVFSLYTDHADLLWDWGASEYYAWSWIRLVPSPAITEGVTIHLDSGEDVTCTFTNEERPAELGSITIVKETDPAGGAGFSFDAGFLGAFSLDDGESNAFDNLLPGDYTVTEVAPTAWYLDNVVCTGGDSDPVAGGATIHLESGEDVICTFTNESHVVYVPLAVKRY